MPKVTLTQAVTKMGASLDALIAVNADLVALMKRQLLPTTTPATTTPAEKKAPAAKPAPAPKPEAPKAKKPTAKKKPAKKAEEVAHTPIKGWWYFKVGEEIAGGNATPCEISLAQPVPVGRVWLRPVDEEKPGKWRAVLIDRVYNERGWLEV